MGAGSQTSLLFLKNVLLRFRYPGVFCLEVLWPVLIVGIVAIMRLGVPPERKPTCHYSPRAMPSAGAVPFMQTYICNLDNPCFRNEKHLQVASEAAYSFSKLSDELGPYLSSSEVLNVLSVSNKSVDLIDTFNKIVEDKPLIDGLERSMYINTYFKDPDKVKDILEKTFNFPPNVTTALMESKINVAELLDLVGAPNFGQVVCDPKLLGKYLTFPDEVNITDVSAVLCSVNDVEGLTNAIISQLNVTKLIEVLSLFERIKTDIGMDSLENVFNNIADMFELFFKSESILQAVGKIAEIPDIANIIRKIPDWIEGIEDLSSGLSSIKSIVSSMEPLMEKLDYDKGSLWMAVNNAVQFADNIVALGNEQWNGTAEEFIQPLRDLIKNIEDVARSPMGQQMADILNFITKIDWPDVYNQIILTSTIDQKTMEYILTNLQEMIEKMPTYPTIKTILRLTDHTMDILTIFTNKSIDLREALKHLVDSHDSLKSTLERWVPYGPDMIKLVLQAFTRPQLLGELMANATSYGTVCKRVMKELQPELPVDIYQDMHDTLCAGSVEEEMTHILTSLKLNDLSDVVNSTAEEIMALYKGDFFGQPVSVVVLYHKYMRFTGVFNDYVYGDKWMSIFNSFDFNFDVNEAGWDQVTDMLTTDFLTNLLISSYRGLGTVLVGTRVSDGLAPTVHMMTNMVKTVYHQLSMMMNSSPDNPIMDAIQMVTTYFPEVVQYVWDMWDNHMDAIYTLAESTDPMQTFCQGNYLTMGRWPAYVPVTNMTRLICDTNWELAFQQFNQPYTEMQKSIEEMIKIFEQPELMSYDIELDWIDMMDYMERIVDMVDLQTLGSMDFTMGYQTMLNSMNFTTLGKGVDILFTNIGATTVNDTEKMVDLMFRILENVDRSSQSDPSWLEFKSGMWVFEAWLDITVNWTKNQVESSSLMELLQQYPPEFVRMNVLLSRAYPEGVKALTNMLRNPEKAFDDFMAQGLHMPDCATHFVSDYFMLPGDSAMRELEQYLCGVDWMKFANDLTPYTRQGSEYMNRIEFMSQSGALDYPINWRVLAVKVMDYLEYLNRPMDFDNFSLDPYNVTAIDMAWQQFYRAGEGLQNLDPNMINSLAMKIQGLFMTGNGSGEALDFFMNGQQYVNYHVLKMINTELSYFNSTPEVILFDYMGVDSSLELAKIRDFLVSSPEINAVGVATLQRLVTHPDKVIVDTDFDRLCSDINQFSNVFVVDTSLYSPEAVQKAVCGLNLNLERLLEDLAKQFPSVMDFIEALEKMSNATSPDDLHVDPALYVEESEKMTALIEALVVYPPVIKITRDSSWTDPEVYVREWEKLGGELDSFGQDLSNTTFLLEWESSLSNLIFKVMEENLGLKDLFGTINGILDVVKAQVDQQTGNSLEALRKYPNADRLLDLIADTQGAVQTFLYTILTQEAKVALWTEALQSSDKFCNTPPSTLFSIPDDVTFDLNEFIKDACELDLEELMKEFEQYQGTTSLELAFNSTIEVNATTLSKKLDAIVTAIVKSDPMTTDQTFDKLFNPLEWEKIGSRINTWYNNSISPENIPSVVLDLMNVVLGSLGEEIEDVFNKAMAIGDVVLDEMYITVNSSNFQDAFRDSPTLQSVGELLNELPEVFETFLYTTAFYNTKMTTKLALVTSWDSFCAMNVNDWLTVAPNSTWDAQAWMSRLCKIDLDQLALEMENSVAGRRVNEILKANRTERVDFASLVKKASAIQSMIDSGRGLQQRVFDPKIWDTVLTRTATYIWPYSSMEEYYAAQEKVIFATIIDSLKNFDGMDELFTYVDVVLDIMMAFEKNYNGKPTDMQQNYPMLSSIYDLAGKAPEMLETVLYTVLTQPNKTEKWTGALQSFDAFCATPVDTIMAVPPGSSFNVEEYLRKVCSIDLDQLNQENLEFNGMDRLMDLLSGSNNTGSVDASALKAKFDKVADALMSMNFELSGDPRLARLFNMTLWEHTIQRIGEFASVSFPDEITAPMLLGVLAQTMDSVLAQMPELQEPYNMALGITTVMVDQALKALDASTVKGVLDMGPNIQKLLDILDYLPEIFETVLYSVFVHPEKIRANADAMTGIVAFCTTRPDEIFTVPPGSDFNLTAVVVKLCTVNMTLLEQEVMEFQTSQDIASILNGTSTMKTDMATLLTKLDTLLQRMDTGATITDRFVNETVWSRINGRVEKWMSNITSINAALISPRTVFLLVNQVLTSDPSVKEALRPVMVSGAVLHQLLHLVLALENRTVIGTNEIFADWEEMRKLFDWIQSEGTLELFMDISSNQKLTALLMNVSAISDFCQAGTPPTKYLSQPSTGQVDLALFQQKFCAIKWEDFGDQFDKYFNMDFIMAVSEGRADFDFEQLQRTMDYFATVLEKWDRAPPKFDLPERWLNETFWTNLFENQFAQMDPANLQNQILDILRQLQPLSDTDGLKQIVIVLNSVLDLVNENLEAMQNAQLTLGNAVEKIPALRHLFDGLGLNKDTLEALMLAPISNATLFAELFTTNDFQREFCTEKRWHEFLDLPANFDTTPLHDALCYGDADQLLTDLRNAFNFTAMVNALEYGADSAKQYEMMMEKVEKLMANFDKAMNNLPTFTTDQVLQNLIDHYTNETQLWAMLSAINTVQDALNVYPELTDTIGGVMGVANVIVDYLNGILARAQVQNGRLDLAGLFQGAPDFVKIVSGVLDIEPDPISGLFSITMKPQKAQEFSMYVTNSTWLRQVFCDVNKFNDIFVVEDSVEVTSALTALCNVDFDVVATQLENSFMVNSLDRNITRALENPGGFDPQAFSNNIERMISQIEGLTHANYLMFGKHDMGDVLRVDTTLLMEALQSQYSADVFSMEYLTVIANSMNDILLSLGPSEDLQPIHVALRFVRVYMSNLNSLLRSVMDKPISLTVLMNNTEVGNILNPILNDPNILENLVNAKVNVSELSKLLEGPDPTSALCGDQLWTVIQIPDSERQAIVNLRDRVCAVNTTVLLWQTIMVSANGYQLKQQMDIISNQVAVGQGSTNVTATVAEMSDFVNLMTTIVDQYSKGYRSLDSLLDIGSFQSLVSRMEAVIAQKLMDQAVTWSIDLADILLPKLVDESTYNTMAKLLNSMNLVMNATIQHLQAVSDGELTLSTLLNNADGLVSLVEAMLRVVRNIGPAFQNKELEEDKVAAAFSDLISNGPATCEKPDELAKKMTDQSEPSATVKDLATVMCAFVDGSADANVRKFVDYDKLEQEMTQLWSAVTVTPEYSAFANNIQRVASLVESLANKTLTISSNLTNTFDLSSLLRNFEDITSDPVMVFRFMRIVGLVLDSSLPKSEEMTKLFSGMNSFAIMPLINVLEALKAKHLSLENIAADPATLLDVMSTLLDFNTHYAVMQTAIIGQQAMALEEDATLSAICTNGTAYPSTVDFVQEFVNLTNGEVNDLFCDLKPTVWQEYLKSKGASQVEILVFFNQLRNLRYYSVDEVFDRNYGWVDLMTSLEKLSTLLTHEKIDRSDIAHAQTAWDYVKDILFDKTIKSVLSYLPYLESMNSQDVTARQELQQFMKFLASTFNFFNKHIEGLGGGHLVKLEDILPNSDRLSKLIQELFGPSNAAELLATSVNSEMFYTLSLQERWDEVCDNSMAMNQLFHFPAGTDVDAVRLHLCQAIKNRTSAFDELVSLFGANDMLRELDNLMQGRFTTDSFDSSVYSMVHTALMKLINSAEKLQNVNLDSGSAQNWLDTILMALNSLQTRSNSQYVQLCSRMVQYLNGTYEYQMAHNALSQAMTAMKMVAEFTAVLPELDNLGCILMGGESINLPGFVEKLTDLNILKHLEKTLEALASPPIALDCSAPVKLSLSIMEVVNQSMTQPGLNFDRFSQCVGKSEEQLGKLISDFSRMMDLIKDILTVMQMPELTGLFSDPSIMRAVEMLLDVIRMNEHGLLAFFDLLSDPSNVEDYLTNQLGLSADTVYALMNASVNSDWAYVLTKSVEEVSDILCNEDRLGQVINLPASTSMNITELSQLLCTAQVRQTALVLKNASYSMSDITKAVNKNYDDIGVAIKNLIDEIADIISTFGDGFDLIEILMGDFSVEKLRENAAKIDRLLRNDMLRSLVESIQNLLKHIEELVPEGIGRTIVQDVQKFIDGLLGLDQFKAVMMEAVTVKDLVNDPQYLKFYMTQQLGFSETMAEAILDGTFSVELFSEVDLQDLSCQEVVDKLIILNSTAATLDEIRSSFCSLTDDQYQELMKTMSPELDIGKFIARYVKYMEDSILGRTNMTKAELNDVVETVDRGQAVLVKAKDIISNSANGSRLLNLFGEAGQSSAFISLESLTPTICAGSPVDIFDTDFNPGVLVTTTEDIEREIEQGIVDEQPDLPNEFCVSMYESIRKSGIGSILWAYLKPIIRGKIVYTPVTPATQAIMKRANSFFDVIDEVNHVATIWARDAPNLLAMADAVSEAKALRDALKNDFVKGLLEATTGISGTTLLSSLDALEANNIDMNQLKGLQIAAELVANYTSCIETDRYVGVDSEEALVNASYHLSKRKLFFAGIVFDELEEDSNTGTRRRRQANPAEEDIAKHVTYTIRMDVDNTMDTNRLKSRLWKMEAEDNFVEDMRYLRGFIFVQDMIDRAIIDVHKNEMYTTPGVRVKQMPFPCHHDDNFVFLLGSYLIPIMMTFVFLASLGIATHNFVYDRENGQEQTLKVMGLIPGLNFMAWLISTMLVMAVVCIVLAVMIKYTEIFIYSNLVLVFLFLLNFCFSSLMLAYMVSAFFNRTTMAILFVLMTYLISYLPYILVISLELTMNFWQKSLACLASTTAFSFGSMSLAHHEETGVGLQWDNIHEEVTKDFSVHWCCMMMLIDSAIYFVIGWYVRGVRPGKYGISQPWYFPILPSYWCSCLSSSKASNEENFTPVAAPGHAGGLFEGAPEGLKVGIAVENLSKSYSKGCCKENQVVDNLNLNFYEGHVTSLLGHNGAAKTTTINMICGVLEPTTGRVLINGQDPGCCKGSLGVCPQQNALFSYMSALQHMMFYAGVKGADYMAPEIKDEIDKLLRDVDMYTNRHVPVKDMSYGMKRRLCVALAFVGGSKIIILDEPTSGIDPNARKNIWTLITRNRPGRTILLSTHHLDEADILSDRIAIMHQGKLLCCGRPAFLKKALGGDFDLTIAKKEPVYDNVPVSQDTVDMRNRSSNAAIVEYVQSMSPKATFKGQIGHDITINLPKEPEHMKVSFHQFFNSIDRFADQLGIQSYGVSDTTLEEVFLELTSRADAWSDRGVVNPVLTSMDRSTAQDIDQNISRPRPSREEKALFSPAVRISHSHFGDKRGPLFIDNARFGSENRRTGCSLSMAQMMALIIKRFHHYRRNWRVLLTCILLPLLTFFIALGFTSVRPDDNDMKPLVLDPAIYGSDVYNFYKDEYNAFRYTNALVDSPVGVGTSCMADTDEELFEDAKCVAGSNWYNRTQRYERVTCRNARQVYVDMHTSFQVDEKVTVNDQKLQNLKYQDITGYLLRTFKDYKDTRFGGWSFEKSRDTQPIEMYPNVWFNSKGYHAMPSYFNGMSNALLRAQLPEGQDPDQYGITTINHPIKFGSQALSVKTLQADAADAGIAIMVVMAFSFIPGGFILYLINERSQKEKQLQNISGVGVVGYWVVAFIWDMLVYMVAVAIAVALVAIFETDSFYIKDNHAAFAVMLTLYGWSIIPLLYCMVRLFDKASTAYLVTFCLNLFLSLATVISLLVMQLFRSEAGVYRAYKICKYLYMIFPQYCLGQGLMDMVSTVFKYKLFQRFGEEIYDDPFSFDVSGYFMLAMGIEGFVFFVAAMILDVLSSPSVVLSHNAKPKAPDDDMDVVRERERVAQDSNSDVLVVDNLSKVYRRGFKKLRAVDHISFGVPQGESFGLLGVNGAGKTTTFRMLTGDLKPAGGRASLNGVELKDSDRLFGQDVGYCPQEGGLDEYLTGEENLYFHARLRGFSGDERKEIVSDLLRCLQLEPFAHRTVSKYSGGTKRKLALAVALLGDPAIVYLDEPTTGMDPATRRLAWACILRANRNGQSVVLTSHSMDECDALCSRIAIMVNGRIKCIGSPQHLKNKFGNGYIVVMHTVKTGNHDMVHTFLNKFPGSVIKAKHNQRYELRVPGNSGRVADIIAFLQAAEREGAIEYYSLSQATLDSVFISFAQEQRDAIEDSDYSSGSSSGRKSDSASGSISSSGAPSTGASSVKKDAAAVDFVNPAFVHSDEPTPQMPSAPSQSRGNYATNITIGSDQPAVKPEDVSITKL